MSHDVVDADAAALLEFLRDRDAFCPVCRYNLRGLTVPRCPECGRELRLSVGATEPFLRAWIMVAVATCAAAGVGVLFAFLLTTAGWPAGSSVSEQIMRALVLFFIATIPAALGVLATRRRFLKLPKAVQWKIAVSATIVIVVAFCLMFATIR